MAERLARDGAAVCIDYRSGAEPAEDLVRSIAAAGGRAIAVGADVPDEVDVARLFDEMASASIFHTFAITRRLDWR